MSNTTTLDPSDASSTDALVLVGALLFLPGIAFCGYKLALLLQRTEARCAQLLLCGGTAGTRKERHTRIVFNFFLVLGIAYVCRFFHLLAKYTQPKDVDLCTHFYNTWLQQLATGLHFSAFALYLYQWTKLAFYNSLERVALFYKGFVAVFGLMFFINAIVRTAEDCSTKLSYSTMRNNTAIAVSNLVVGFLFVGLAWKLMAMKIIKEKDKARNLLLIAIFCTILFLLRVAFFGGCAATEKSKCGMSTLESALTYPWLPYILPELGTGAVLAVTLKAPPADGQQSKNGEEGKGGESAGGAAAAKDVQLQAPVGTV